MRSVLFATLLVVSFWLPALAEVEGPSDLDEPRAQLSLFKRTVVNAGGEQEFLFDVFLRQGLPPDRLREAFEAYESASKSQHLLTIAELENKKSVFSQKPVREMMRNREVLTMVNVATSMSEKSFVVLDLKTGQIDRMEVSHGFTSDENGIGKNFSNIVDSHQTSLGSYLTDQKTFFYRPFGRTLKLHGLSKTNSNALKRKIWAHEYDLGPGYSQVACENRERRNAGHPEWCRPEGELDEGCLAIPRGRHGQETLRRIANGSVIYVYAAP